MHRRAQAYFPYGAPRTTEVGALPTDYTFTGQKLDAAAGLMYYGARYYDATLGRFISADTLVPDAANPQALNRYAYTLNNPLKYTDPTGHCPTCWAGMKIGMEIGYRISGREQMRRDQIGGELVVGLSERIAAESARRGIDPEVVGAILRHESGAFERRFFTSGFGYEAGSSADTAETIEAMVRGGIASIGPGQMQVRRAEELESLGYVTRRSDAQARIAALLDPKTAVEYVAGMVQYLYDQLDKIPGFNDLNSQDQERIVLIGYNRGWEILARNLEARGFRGVIDLFDYDNQTLDEYLRWRGKQ